MKTQDARQRGRDTTPELLSKALATSGQTVDRTLDREPSVQEPPHLLALPDPFQIFESTTNGRRVIALFGELDLSNAAELEERLAGNIDTVLDLSQLSFIDSSGIHVLISTAQRAQLEAWEFTVRNPQPAVLRVFKLLALDPPLRLESHNGQTEDANPSSPLV